MSKAAEKVAAQERIERAITAPIRGGRETPRPGTLCGATGRPHDFSMRWKGQPPKCLYCCRTREQVAKGLPATVVG